MSLDSDYVVTVFEMTPQGHSKIGSCDFLANNYPDRGDASMRAEHHAHNFIQRVVLKDGGFYWTATACHRVSKLELTCFPDAERKAGV